MASREPRYRLVRSSRRQRLLTGAVLVLGFIALGLTWPTLIRHVVIARIEAIAHRPVSIEAIHANPLTGRIDVQGLRLLDRDGQSPFADFERLIVSVRTLSMLFGHLSIRNLVLEGPNVRVVQLPDTFNLSDIIEHSAANSRVRDVTIDHFVLTKGAVTFEDRSVSLPRTWRSERIEIEARNLSTRREDGTATASAVTAGASVSLTMRKVRLSPIHLEADVTATGFDVTLARFYVPPDAPVLERGRVSSRLQVMLDARDGIRANATAEIRDVVLMKPGERDPTATAPKLTVEVSDLLYQNDKFEVGRFELAGSASIRDPTAGSRGRMQLSTIRASIVDATWPITKPGRLDVQSSVPGGGTLAVTGQLNAPPTASHLRLRLARVDLAPWTRLVPVKVRIEGKAEADLRIDEPLAPGVPSRVQGQVAVNGIGIHDGDRQLFTARRIEAGGLEMHWPSRLDVKRVVISGPRATIERDKVGGFPVQALLNGGSSDSSSGSTDSGSSSTEGPHASDDPQVFRASGPPKAPPIALTVGEVIATDGAVAWRDAAVTPPVALDFNGLDAKVSGGVWPIRGPVDVRVSLVPPGGGWVQVAGRVGIDPKTANLRVSGRDAELASYQAYVPAPARIAGRADFDLTVVIPESPEGSATARGAVAISRVDIRDGERTVMKVDRASATGVDIDWPQRVLVRDLRLQQPWALFERDRAGALPLRVLLSPRTRRVSANDAVANSVSADSSTGSAGESVVPVTLGHVVIENGGARIVDQHVAPPFALDVTRLTGQVDRLSTDPGAKRAQIELTGRVGATSILTVHGTVGWLGGPLRLDVNGDLRGFAVPRTNPYLVEQVAWEARDGWLSTAFSCRVDGDRLDAKTDITLSRLQVARAGANDQAQSRIGLPVGMIVALMKNSRGDIHVTLPIGGRLSDPHFDMSEAIWSTIRNVAVKAITAPVRWIGRVQLDSQSRIERIDVDPIRFAPGQATLTPGTREQVTRIAAYLDQTPEMRMALTPVVSSGDRAALGRKMLDPQITRMARDQQLSLEEATARLFKERFPQQPVPETTEAMLAALAENEAALPSEIKDLAAQRLKAVYDGIKKAGIDGKRLKEDATPAMSGARDGQVKLDLVAPESPGPAERPNFFKRLLGRAKREPSPVRE